MKQRTPADRPASRIMGIISPAPLLAGVLIGFVACCVAGYVCSRQNPYRKFTRFHINLSPDTYYYPTASQFINLARGSGDKSKITVIVGGSSVMQGAGQMPAELWTLRLQELLGPRYRVVNLATRGGSAPEGAAIAAEVLRREGYPVIYLTSLNPFQRPPMDGERHIYQFWDAWYKGEIQLDDPARAAEQAALAKARMQPPKQKSRGVLQTVAQDQLTSQETLLGARLNSWCYFDDLWTTAAYKRFVTVWTPRTAGYPWTPRRDVIDPEGPQPPAERRFVNMDPRISTSMIRGQSANCLVKSPDGQWTAPIQTNDSPKSVEYQDFRRRIPLMFSGELRPATVVVVIRNNPYFVRMLSADDRARYDTACRMTVDYLRSTGHASELLGESYTDGDYADWIHLVGQGGRKLAEDIAPLVRRQADALGYKTEAHP